MSVRDRTDSLPAADAAPSGEQKLGLALLVIAAAQLMLVLDGTIVNVALPSIQRSLNFPQSDLNWVLTAYALTFGGLLMVGGRAGDLFGRKRVFRAGVVVFTLASLLGGLATTEGMLLAARALQGVGAAVAAPTALSLLATTFPAGPARNKALGVYGAVGGLGSVIGLLLGGALTDYLSWRWVLFINIPIAVAVLIGTGVLIEGDREHGRIDLPGAITVTAGLGSLVFAINWANTHSWTAAYTLFGFAAAAVLLVAFLIIQRLGTAAMLPPRVIRDRGRFGANVVMFLTGAGMFATFYFLTLYMQVIKDYSPMRTGVAYLPFAAGIILAAAGIGPRLLSLFSERTVTITGLLLAATGMAWFSALTPTTSPFAALLPAQLVAGIGAGLALVTTTIVGVRGVALQDTGIASGLLNTSQQIGSAVGLAVLVTIASAATRSRLPGTPLPDALTHGYSVGVMVGGALYLAAVVITALTFRASSKPEPDPSGPQA
jgi:EmrB/QacA subfamily drug resistance transporter